jgi:hypothetical protein
MKMVGIDQNICVNVIVEKQLHAQCVCWKFKNHSDLDNNNNNRKVDF